MTAQDFVAVYSPHPQPLLGYLTQRKDVCSASIASSGWLVAHGHPRGSRAHQERGTVSVKDERGDLHVLVGTGALDEPLEQQRFIRCLRESPEHLGTFSGDFTAVLLEPGGVARFVQACSGAPPLYVASTADQAWISTRLDWLAVLLPAPLEPDWLSIGVYLTGWAAFPEQRSFIRGVSRPAAGSAGRIQVGRSPLSQRYWFPERLLREPTTLEEAAAQLRAQVVSQLKRTLAPEPTGNNLLLFSGGVDSACLAALMQTLELSVHAVSMLPLEQDVAFARESRFVHAVSETFTHHHCFPTGAAEVLALLKPTSRLGLPLTAGWLVLSSWDARPKTGTVLTGWFADECWGALRFMDWLNGRSLRELPRLMRFTRHPLRMLARWIGVLPTRTLDLPEELALFYPDEVRVEYQEWRSRIRHLPGAPNHVRQLELNRRYRNYTGVYSEAASLLGYESLCPFASREVIEQAYRLPPQLFYNGGLNKLPLRRAVPELPPLYARRKDKGGHHASLSYDGLISAGDLHPQLQQWVDKAAGSHHDGRGLLAHPTPLVAGWVVEAVDGWEDERAKRENAEQWPTHAGGKPHRAN